MNISNKIANQKKQIESIQKQYEISEDEVKIIKDMEGTPIDNNETMGTKTYINFDFSNFEQYTITTDPKVPYEISQNGRYDFNVNIMDHEGKSGTVWYTVRIDFYQEE